MEYSGVVSYGDMYDMGKSEKLIHVRLNRKDQISDEE
jgi:hypothetical protein